MICKICGSEMKNNGDWFACPTCGSVHFGPDPDAETSAAEQEIKEEEPVPEKADEPVKKEEPLLDFDKLFYQTEEPTAEPEEESVTEEEPPAETVEIAEEITEAEEPSLEAEESIDDITAEPEEAQEKPEEDGIDIANIFEEPSVKPDTFTLDKDAFSDNFSSFLDSIENSEEEEEEEERPRRRRNKKSDEEDEENGEKKKLTLKDIVDFMLPIVAALVIAFILKTFIIANAKVPTGSMIATINIEDRIIASRLAYRTEDPQRYDIVLFYYPDDENDIFVKRVLGLPGETVEEIDGVVYVTTDSGRTIQTDHSFVNPAETPVGDAGPYYIPAKGETITVKGSLCYAENGALLGNRGFLNKYCIQDDHGNYVVAENLYFMIGDNRNQSHDSRKWDYPYVAENKIIGKVLFKYYPSFEKIE